MECKRKYSYIFVYIIIISLSSHLFLSFNFDCFSPLYKSVGIKQMRNIVLISNFYRCYWADFIIFGQHQACCFPLPPVQKSAHCSSTSKANLWMYSSMGQTSQFLGNRWPDILCTKHSYLAAYSLNTDALNDEKMNGFSETWRGDSKRRNPQILLTDLQPRWNRRSWIGKEIRGIKHQLLVCRAGTRCQNQTAVRQISWSI